MKVIFHLDLDCYFVSAHRTIDSFLKNKSVVISSGGKRSIISSASYEARKKGIYVPMPFYKAKALDPEVISVKPNFSLYVFLSSQVFELLSKKYTPNIEIASIDEWYMDVTRIWKNYKSPTLLAKDIQKTIMEKLKLSVSIGIASNKFVAKMASPINKPFGITVVKPGDFLKIFGNLDIKKFFGIGNSAEKKLKEQKIFTIEDLANADINILKNIFGKRAAAIHLEANGFGSDKLEYAHNHLKTISSSQTFLNYDKKNLNDVLKTLSTLVKIVSLKAQNRNLIGKVVFIQLKESGKSKKSKQITLSESTNSFKTIFLCARKLLEKLWNKKPLRFIGVGITKLSNIFTSTFQSSIYDECHIKSKTLEVINLVNKKMKARTLVTGKEFVLNQLKKQTKYLKDE